MGIFFSVNSAQYFDNKFVDFDQICSCVEIDNFLLWCAILSIIKLTHPCKILTIVQRHFHLLKWAPSSEFVCSSIPSWQILTAHAQPFRGARDLTSCLKAPLDSLLVGASSEGSGETARMRRLAWTFAARIGYKYQIRLTRSKMVYVMTSVLCIWLGPSWFS